MCSGTRIIICFAGSVSDTAEETVEIILKPRNTNSTAESRYLKTTSNASIQHIKYIHNVKLFAIIWGYLLLSENVNYTSIIGIILILFGVYVGRKN